MLVQVIRAMKCFFAAFIGARILLFWVMSEFMTSSVFGSSENLYVDGKHHFKN
jgi:hypothetical protein